MRGVHLREQELRPARVARRQHVQRALADQLPQRALELRRRQRVLVAGARREPASSMSQTACCDAIAVGTHQAVADRVDARRAASSPRPAGGTRRARADRARCRHRAASAAASRQRARNTARSSSWMCSMSAGVAGPLQAQQVVADLAGARAEVVFGAEAGHRGRRSAAAARGSSATRALAVHSRPVRRIHDARVIRARWSTARGRGARRTGVRPGRVRRWSSRCAPRDRRPRSSGAACRSCGASASASLDRASPAPARCRFMLVAAGSWASHEPNQHACARSSACSSRPAGPDSASFQGHGRRALDADLLVHHGQRRGRPRRRGEERASPTAVHGTRSTSSQSP